MSIVVVDIDNDYETDLCYSYQLIKEDNDSYSVWISTSIFSGTYAGQNIESFEEAFQLLIETVKCEEMMEIA